MSQKAKEEVSEHVMWKQGSIFNGIAMFMKFWCHLQFNSDLVAVTIPPLIMQQPNKSMAFRELESIELPCVATGQPEPT